MEFCFTQTKRNLAPYRTAFRFHAVRIRCWQGILLLANS